MANCNNCIQLNAIPGCIDSEAFLLEGIEFPAYVDEFLKARVRNMATGRITYITFETDGSGTPDLDIVDLYPMPHDPIEIKFITTNGSPANFVLTNPDTTTEEGCCIEFRPDPSLVGTDTWELSSQACSV